MKQLPENHPRVGPCPLEQEIARALDTGCHPYITEREGAALDFFVEDLGIHIEVKSGDSERTARQIQGFPNVILVKGRKATKALAKLLAK